MSKNTITITIQRPTGNIEVLDVTAKFSGMNDHLFAQIKQSTEAAGRGTVLSYNVARTDAQIRSDLAEKEYCKHYDAVVKAMSY